MPVRATVGSPDLAARARVVSAATLAATDAAPAKAVRGVGRLPPWRPRPRETGGGGSEPPRAPPLGLLAPPPRGLRVGATVDILRPTPVVLLPTEPAAPEDLV